MKNLVISTILSISLVLAISCQKEKGYKSLTIESMSGLSGYGEIEPENASNYYKFVYDGDELVRVEQFIEGRIRTNRSGVAIVEINHSDDKTVVVSLFDHNNKKANYNYNSYHKRVIKRTGEKSAEVIFLNQKDKPTDFEGTWMEKWALDGKGQVISFSLFDKVGKPRAARSGIHKTERKFDERGFVVEEKFLSVSGQPAVRSGIIGFSSKYDEKGNVTELTYFDKNNKVINSPEGWAKLTVDYRSSGDGDKNSIVEETVFKADGSPAIFAGEGSHQNRMKQDSRQNVVERSYFGQKGEPVRNQRYGYHKATFSYDENGNLTSQKLFGVKGEPISSANYGWHRDERKYDKKGNLVEILYFDEKGEPATDTYYNAAKQLFSYDAKDYLIEESNFDVLGKPCEGLYERSWHRATYKYDSEGNQVEISYFGKDLNPGRGFPGSVHRIVYTFVPQTTQRATMSFYDAEGKKANSSYGYHEVQYVYDDDFNLKSYKNLGVDGKLIREDPAIPYY